MQNSDSGQEEVSSEKIDLDDIILWAYKLHETRDLVEIDGSVWPYCYRDAARDTLDRLRDEYGIDPKTQLGLLEEQYGHLLPEDLFKYLLDEWSRDIVTYDDMYRILAIGVLSCVMANLYPEIVNSVSIRRENAYRVKIIRMRNSQDTIS